MGCAPRRLMARSQLSLTRRHVTTAMGLADSSRLGGHVRRLTNSSSNSSSSSSSSAADSFSHRVKLASVPNPTRRQLVSLALASGVPFIGFGFADNLIMILVGDRIDCTLGVKFGLSTLAAAGLGNLISDVVGISLGEVIEAWTARLITTPPLAPEQLNLPRTRFLKASANAVGISIGCLLGMFPLFFMHDRKSVFFDDDEMAMYHQQFAPYGVSPQQFFALLHHGQWRTAEAGQPMVTKGEILSSVFFLHSGSAHAVVCDAQGHETLVALYNGNADDVASVPSHVARGCIIGGTALVDSTLSGRPYPNTVTLTQRAKYLEWNTEELRQVMREDKSVEAAVLSTLYLDLIRGQREQKQSSKQEEDEATRSSLRREYELMLRAVLADGLVHPLEKAMLHDYANKHGVSDAQHDALLLAEGWSKSEWDQGVKEVLKTARVQRHLSDVGTARGDEEASAAERRPRGRATLAPTLSAHEASVAMRRHLTSYPDEEPPEVEQPHEQQRVAWQAEAERRAVAGR